MPDTKSLFLAGRVDLGFPHADDRHGLPEGVEHLQLVAGFLTDRTFILLDHGGDVSAAQVVRGDVLGQDDPGEEFVFHDAVRREFHGLPRRLEVIWRR